MEISKGRMSAAARLRQTLRIPGTSCGPKSSSRRCRLKTREIRLGLSRRCVLHIYDAFYKQDTIQHVLVRHEQAPCMPPTAIARATGDVAWRWSPRAPA